MVRKVECKGKSAWSWAQLEEIDRGLSVLRQAGLGIGTAPFDILYKARGEMLRYLSVKLPKPVVLLSKLLGLSPGVINVWFDSEGGFFTQARSDPRLPWATHYVGDNIAITLLKGELTHELEDFLMTPDDFEGN